MEANPYLSVTSIAIYILIGVGLVVLVGVLIHNYWYKKITYPRQITTFTNYLFFKYLTIKLKNKLPKNCFTLLEVILLDNSFTKSSFLEYCLMVITPQQLYLVAYPLEKGVQKVTYNGNQFACHFPKKVLYLALNSLVFATKQSQLLTYLKSYGLNREQIQLIMPIANKKFVTTAFNTPWQLHFMAVEQVENFIVNHHQQLVADQNSVPTVTKLLPAESLFQFLKKNNCAKKRVLPFFRQWTR